jgi:hypothetical protein
MLKTRGPQLAVTTDVAVMTPTCVNVTTDVVVGAVPVTRTVDVVVVCVVADWV